MLRTNVSVGGFSAFALKLRKYPEFVMEETVCLDGSRRMRPSNLAKVAHIKQALSKSLAKVIERQEAFCFKPYSLHVEGDHHGSTVQRAERGDQPGATRGLLTKI